MPNHVTHRIYANPVGLRKLKDYCVTTDDDGHEMFDFNTIIPEPDPKPENWDNNALGGTGSWYDWRCNNWGTKWGAYNFDECPDYLSFQTAWSTPTPIWERLATMFPNDRFVILFADEDIGTNYGMIILENNQARFAVEPFGSYHNERAKVFASIIVGYDVEYRIEEMEYYNNLEEFCDDYGFDYKEGVTTEETIRAYIEEHENSMYEFIEQVKQVVNGDGPIAKNLLTFSN